MLLIVALAPRAAADGTGFLAVQQLAEGDFVHVGLIAPVTPDNAGDIANLGIIVGADAVAVVDTGGLLVYFEKMDDTQAGSVVVAQAKARSAALFKRATKAFQETLAAGGDGLRVLALEGAVPVDGGIPLLVGGRIAGAIGVSGGTSAEDGQCAQAGVDALR